ncbi:YiiX/YebB-like N1pC/P60 family cysteine hydrolase [Luteimonas sp. RC10]|uniref:YiiX/YebB-like N1pC/P60 family cysteine hydrolase n=1 Tax=Luteimonas sp. RC10 TaxID=2587035 RepID=UPI00160D293A|nr:YiiX/YebB-like N1pC/P60 family cysteine hydrolase [Luteimonas sp. RC10]MBB3344904.1 cell wall-associated NlpC family hydrolase [Luteimonas sp. RC10]
MWRWWCALLALCAASVCLAGGPALPAEAQAGDLVFRRGTESVSAMVLAIDGGQFSHVGMLVGRPGTWQVVHATPSEVPGRADGVVVDALSFFLDPVRSRDYAVYRVDAPDALRAAAVGEALGQRGTRFRMADPAGTYCTRLVWEAWRRAGVDLEVRFTRLALPLMQGDYLLPTPLSRSPRLRRLALPQDAEG